MGWPGRNKIIKTGEHPETAVNFEDLDYEKLQDYKTLYCYVKERLIPDRMNYIFLDEVQHVNAFEKAVEGGADNPG